MKGNEGVGPRTCHFLLLFESSKIMNLGRPPWRLGRQNDSGRPQTRGIDQNVPRGVPETTSTALLGPSAAQMTPCASQQFWFFLFRLSQDQTLSFKILLTCPAHFGRWSRIAGEKWTFSFTTKPIMAERPNWRPNTKILHRMDHNGLKKLRFR